eukprot:gb/GECG01007941.1/.p1 GENE.gb/GECG01007941.1/~~gb/GECG01007941.1/.p1  ORF type:complete len:181 (+),score=31.64 gb/GECG01007941.1/:1-543(+)
MPQNEHTEEFQKRHGTRPNFHEKVRKQEARMAHKRSEYAQNVKGLRAKLHNEKRFKEKVQMKKTKSTHEEKEAKAKKEEADNGAAVPAYLLDRENTQRAKVLSNTIKQKRKEKAGKWEVPVPKVKPISDDEMFRVVTTGKRKGTNGGKRNESQHCKHCLYIVVFCSQGLEAHGYKANICW